MFGMKELTTKIKSDNITCMLTIQPQGICARSTIKNKEEFITIKK
jgi:hypothetical protein